MKNILLRALLGLVLACLGLVGAVLSPALVFAVEEPLLKKEEWWGPCPLESVCHQTTALYESGSLIFEGRENKKVQLTAEKVADIVAFIRSAKLLEKSCPGDPNTIADFSASYQFNVDGSRHTIQLPGCEEDLRALDGLLQPVSDQAPAKTTPL